MQTDRDVDMIKGGVKVRQSGKRFLGGSVAAATLAGIADARAGDGRLGRGGGSGRDRQADHDRLHLVRHRRRVPSEFKTADKTCDARVKRQNKAGRCQRAQDQRGGERDQSSGANLTTTKDLIQNRGAFIVVNNSSGAFLSYRTMLDNNVPMVGGGYDGDCSGCPGAESIFNALGTPFTGISNDATAPAHEAPRRDRARGSGERVALVDRLGPGTPGQGAGDTGNEGRLHEQGGRLRLRPTSGRSCSASRTPAPTPSTCRSSSRQTSRSCRASPRTTCR